MPNTYNQDYSHTSSKSGMVINIQRCSLHDGPGLRTTVFLKGCPLQCIWCHNPESISSVPELLYHKERCVECGKCKQVCPLETHKHVRGVHEIDRQKCTGCGICVQSCQYGALDIVGRKMTADEIIKLVIRDQHFYSHNGGLTVSGGEPTLQAEFTFTLLSLARINFIHTAIETSGFCSWDKLEMLLANTDLFMFDLKESDPVKHELYTSKPLWPIMENLKHLCAVGANIILRCPLIPGLNDRPEHLKYIAKLTQRYPQIVGAELMPYHKLGHDKRKKLGTSTPSNIQAKPPSQEQINNWNKSILNYGGRLVS